MIFRVKSWLMAACLLLLTAQSGAASLADIQVSNGDSQARITFSFIGDPEYAFSQDDKKSDQIGKPHSNVCVKSHTAHFAAGILWRLQERAAVIIALDFFNFL